MGATITIGSIEKMKNAITTSLLIVSFVLTASSITSAKGLLGRSYSGLSYARIDYGDDAQAYLDDGHATSVVYNINKDDDTDIQIGVSYLWTSGNRLGQNVDISSLAFSLDMVQVFADSNNIKPYFNIGLRAIDTDVDGPGLADEDADVGLGIGLGIEFQLHPQLFATVAVGHDNVGDDTSLFSATGGWWLTDHIVGLLGIARDTESDIMYYQGGLVFPF